MACFRCDGILNDEFIANVPESVSERILKIGQYVVPGL